MDIERTRIEPNGIVMQLYPITESTRDVRKLAAHFWIKCSNNHAERKTAWWTRVKEKKGVILRKDQLDASKACRILIRPSRLGEIKNSIRFYLRGWESTSEIFRALREGGSERHEKPQHVVSYPMPLPRFGFSEEKPRGGRIAPREKSELKKTVGENARPCGGCSSEAAKSAYGRKDRRDCGISAACRERWWSEDEDAKDVRAWGRNEENAMDSLLRSAGLHNAIPPAPGVTAVPFSLGCPFAFFFFFPFTLRQRLFLGRSVYSSNIPVTR